MIRQSSNIPLDQTIMDLALQVLGGEPLTKAQAMELVNVEGEALYDLFFWANKIKTKFVGPHVKFCSIVTGKVGACSEDCSYCSQSKHYKTHVTPSKMSVEEMENAAAEAAANGANAFGIVNSGKGPTDAELEWMRPFFEKTAKEGKISPCATLGELTPDQAEKLVDMGVTRINHNLETSRRNFEKVTTTHTYQDRVDTIKNAVDAGMHICAGGIFGMGENWEDRVDMAIELRELGVDTVPVNFLYAIQGTPLYGKAEELAPMECLKIIAIYRFINHDAHIKVAGGREKVLRDAQSWAFFCGASSFLIGNYLTTFGRTPKDDHQMLKDLGLKYTDDTGVVYEPNPEIATEAGPGHEAAPGKPMMLSRRENSLMALPVLNQGEKPIDPINRSAAGLTQAAMMGGGGCGS
ncbi:biotin synthase BioB [Poriferisphaera sp. WC338]|uniref:biotin synthase BioB n=1 Tax=Poriferisphaera sp. WC338 TaxID=3425129 RepID=UPI003D81ABBF